MKNLLKPNFLPIFALLGIILGAIFFFLDFRRISELIWLLTLILGGLPIIYQTSVKIAKKEFASDIVAMLAIITAFLTQQFFAGAIVVLMQSGGEAIEAYGLRRASFSLTELLKKEPRLARRKRGTYVEEIDVKEVIVGDLLVIRQGDLIPVDGLVIEGEAEVDESSLTGEPLTQLKQKGDLLFSGTINMNGSLVMVAQKISQKSHYAKIVEMVRRAQEEKAPIQRLADRYALFFTPFTLLIALLGYLLTLDLNTVLSVLVVATPCPLILATPLAVISAMSRAAKEGIIVKGGASIEQIASVKAVLFDKTGTLTFGTPVLEKIISLGSYDEKELLRKAASIEQFSSHTIAKSLVEEALKHFSSLFFPEKFQEVPGFGVMGYLDQLFYQIGSEKWLNPSKNDPFSSFKAEPFLEEGKRILYFFEEKKPIGIFIFSDQLRKESFSIVQKLQELNIEKMALLTGDAKSSAERVGKKIGFVTIEANLSPEDKLLRVKSYQEKYRSVAMVGDGINDAPALASATVGIAMGAHGSAISAESADIVILVDDLSKVVDTIRIGQRMLRIAKQSIFIGMGLSIFLMFLVLRIEIVPAVGAILQEIIDVAVILNALRALK